MVLPVIVVLLASLLIWGFWLPDVNGLPEDANLWNFAPWPFGIPVGLYLIFRAWKADDEVLAASAPPFFVPYFGVHSLAPLLALLACKYRREAIYLYAGFWFYLIVESRRLALIGCCSRPVTLESDIVDDRTAELARLNERLQTQIRSVSGWRPSCRGPIGRLLETARHLTASIDLKDVLTQIAVSAKEILRGYGCAICTISRCDDLSDSLAAAFARVDGEICE